MLSYRPAPSLVFLDSSRKTVSTSLNDDKDNTIRGGLLLAALTWQTIVIFGSVGTLYKITAHALFSITNFAYVICGSMATSGSATEARTLTDAPESLEEQCPTKASGTAEELKFNDTSKDLKRSGDTAIGSDSHRPPHKRYKHDGKEVPTEGRRKVSRIEIEQSKETTPNSSLSVPSGRTRQSKGLLERASSFQEQPEGDCAEKNATRRAHTKTRDARNQTKQEIENECAKSTKVKETHGDLNVRPRKTYQPADLDQETPGFKRKIEDKHLTKHTRYSTRLAAQEDIIDQQYPMRSGSSCPAIRRGSSCSKPCLVFSKYCRFHTESNSEDEFYSAVEDGNVKLVHFLIERKRVDAKSMDGYAQSLARASYLGHEKLVRLFLGQRDVKLENEHKQTPLWWAAREGHVNMFQFLVDRTDIQADGKDIHGRTPLHAAAMHGHEKIVRFLLDRKDVNADQKNNNGETPLWGASRNGREEVVRLMLDHADINLTDKQGRTALYIAARIGHEGVVRLLLDPGKANIDVKNKDGETALWVAARYGRKGITQILLNSKNVNTEDDQGRTPLYIAARYGQEAVVRLLLGQNGIKPDHKDKKGRTPLWIASSYGHDAVIRRLLHCKVDINSEDSNGQTPLSIAESKNMTAAVKLLKPKHAARASRDQNALK